MDLIVNDDSEIDFFTFESKIVLKNPKDNERNKSKSFLVAA